MKKREEKKVPWISLDWDLKVENNTIERQRRGYFETNLIIWMLWPPFSVFIPSHADRYDLSLGY